MNLQPSSKVWDKKSSFFLFIFSVMRGSLSQHSWGWQQAFSNTVVRPSSAPQSKRWQQRRNGLAKEVGYESRQTWETEWEQTTVLGHYTPLSTSIPYLWMVTDKDKKAYLWHLSSTADLQAIHAQRKVLRIKISTLCAPKIGLYESTLGKFQTLLSLEWHHLFHHPCASSCYSLGLCATEHRIKFTFFLQSSSSDSKRKSQLSPVLPGRKRISFGELKSFSNPIN